MQSKHDCRDLGGWPGARPSRCRWETVAGSWYGNHLDIIIAELCVVDKTYSKLFRNVKF